MFFERLGWRCVSGPPENNDMYKLVWGMQGARPARAKGSPGQDASLDDG
jgi:hypothetical protein